MADIIHVEHLSKDEYKKYNIKQQAFLVHLFTGKKIISFELFIGENLEWQCFPAFKGDPEIIQMIGLEIHNRSM